MNKQTNTAALSDALPPKRMLDRHRPTGIALYGYNEDDMRAFRAEGVAAERERWEALVMDYAIACGELSKGLPADHKMWDELRTLGERIPGPNVF